MSKRGPNKFRPDRSTREARSAMLAVGHSAECATAMGNTPLAGCPKCSEIVARVETERVTAHNEDTALREMNATERDLTTGG